LALGILSLRAPIFALRCARAAAALAGRAEVTREDAALAAQLVLLHRAGAVESLRGLRIAATTCALAALAVGFLAIIDFQIADRRYRGLAQDERTLAEALVAKTVVDREHAFASNVMTAEVVSLLALAALTAASTRRNRRA
jgi:hypothetical protein